MEQNRARTPDSSPQTRQQAEPRPSKSTGANARSNGRVMTRHRSTAPEADRTGAAGAWSRPPQHRSRADKEIAPQAPLQIKQYTPAPEKQHSRAAHTNEAEHQHQHTEQPIYQHYTQPAYPAISVHAKTQLLCDVIKPLMIKTFRRGESI